MSDLKTQLIKYSNDVISGKIVSCQKHKWACIRFLRDIDREDTEEFPYIFKIEKAGRFFKWMRLFKHRKGVLKGKNIEPAPIQLFIFGNIYGWYHRDTLLRRFNKFYWQVARKNAKSQSLSVVASYELMAFDENGLEASEVYCAATKTEQAKIVYDETVAMLNGCVALKGTYTTAYGRITHNKTLSVMRALSEEDKKTGDGLNPQCGIIDEYHAHETPEVYEIIDSGMGAREQPLLAIITTAGFDPNNPCKRVEYALVTKILNPDNDFELDSYFAMINELEMNDTLDEIVLPDGKKVAPGEMIDDINDESTWEKANPIICSYEVGKDYLRKKIKEANGAPEKMRNLKTKHFNIWVNEKEIGYMNLVKWAACGQSDGDLLPVVNGTYKYTPFCGVDLSSTIDLTSVSYVFNLQDGGQYVKSHSFMPEATVDDAEKRDKVPYRMWISQGWITATPGSEVDYHMVLQWIKDQYKTNNWGKGEVCYDRHLMTWLQKELEKAGFEPIDIPQSYTGLSLATKDLRAKVINKKIIHENDPVLNWAMSNAVVRCGPSENIMLDKSAARFRIDPVASLVNAMVRAIANEMVDHVYEKRGMRTL
jgi:phage terminase large subunit-like protein